MENKEFDTTPVQSASEGPMDHGDSKKSTYQKIHTFFGFTRPYNFPLCKSCDQPLFTKPGLVLSITTRCHFCRSDVRLFPFAIAGF